MKRVWFLAFLTLVVLFTFGAPAFAHSSHNPPSPGATPQSIYNDYLHNHPRLAGDYTKAELKAYLNDATIHQYGDPKVLAKLDRYVQKLLNKDHKGKGDKYDKGGKGDDRNGGGGSSKGDDGRGGNGGRYSPYQVVGGHSIPFSVLGVVLMLVAAVAMVGGGVALRRFTH